MDKTELEERLKAYRDGGKPRDSWWTPQDDAKTDELVEALWSWHSQAVAERERKLKSIIWKSIGDNIAWDDGRFGGISKMALNDYIENQRRDARRMLAELEALSPKEKQE